MLAGGLGKRGHGRPIQGLGHVRWVGGVEAVADFGEGDDIALLLGGIGDVGAHAVQRLL